MVVVVQLVRTPDCGSGGRRFESGLPPFFLTMLLRKIRTKNPIKATIKEENNITYLNASCRSRIEADSISLVNIIEKINTPMLPIEAATAPLPPSSKPNALP